MGRTLPMKAEAWTFCEDVLPVNVVVSLTAVRPWRGCVQVFEIQKAHRQVAFRCSILIWFEPQNLCNHSAPISLLEPHAKDFED